MSRPFPGVIIAVTRFGRLTAMVMAFVLCFCFAVCSSGYVAAQPAASGPAGSTPIGPGAMPPSPDLQRQYNAAFADMLADPANLDKIFKFAELAVAAGDLEGAVSALERMLLINADLPRVRLELGVLYFRLGSYEAAKTYLLTALSSKSLPPDVLARAEKFLAEIEKERSPSKLAGTLLIGIRYQSNANAAPTGNVKVGGIDASLDDSSTAASDWNVFAALNALHLYDMGTQFGEVWETRLTGYGARQFERTDVNVSLASVDTGPRFAVLPRHIEGLSLRPSVAFDYVAIDDRTDYVAHGASVSLDKRIGMGRIGATFDWRERQYHDSKNQLFNSNRDGRELAGRLTWDFVLAAWLTGSATAGYVDYKARRSFESYEELQLGLSLVAYLDFSPFVKTQKGALVLSGAHLRSDYDQTDPTIDPDTKREDRDWRISLTGSLPLTESLSLVAQGGYSKRNSSLPNYEYKNWFGMSGIAWRF